MEMYKFISKKNVMIKKEKLREIAECINWTRSEIYSSLDTLPDYRANEVTRDHLGNAESYVNDVEDMVLGILSEMNTEDDIEND